MKTRIVIVDDHSIVRAGLRCIIRTQADMEVVAETGNATEALAAVMQYEPDLVLMDISMPIIDGIEISRQILAKLPKTKIIILSALAEEQYINQAIKAGACGYMLKENATADLIPGIRAVVGGFSFLSPEITHTVLAVYKDLLALKESSTKSLLSSREQEVLKMIAEGLRTKEIALRLNIGTKTVETYRARLLEKLKCTSTNELVRYAIREGISPA